MKTAKRLLSLLLVLCMVLSMVPASVFAADHPDAASDFQAILYLDAARKYLKPNVIKQYISDAKDLGYTHVVLYLSDNQGFRFALANTAFHPVGTDGKDITDTTYDLLTDHVVNPGIYTDDPADNHEDWFRPSQEDKNGSAWFLTEPEMDSILAFAQDKGIEIIPGLNMPGHMGAILANRPSNWRASNTHPTRGTQTETTLNVDNADAVAYTKGILKAYVAYFAAKGCHYFSIGGDEYAYDTGHHTSDIVSASDATLYTKLVNFMNDCGDIVSAKGMTPCAFSDFFTTDTNKSPRMSTEFEVFVWQADKVALQQQGYKVINVTDSCYYALGSKWYDEAELSGRINSFDVNKIAIKGGSTGTFTSTPDGAMMCIWCDRGYYDADKNNGVEEPNKGDGGITLYDHSIGYVQQFAGKLRAAGKIGGADLSNTSLAKPSAGAPILNTVIEELKVGDTADFRFTVQFENALPVASTYNALFNPTGVMEATVTQKTAPQEATHGSLAGVTAPVVGQKVLISSGKPNEAGTLYLTASGTTLGVSTNIADAAYFTVEEGNNNTQFRFKLGSNYLMVGNPWGESSIVLQTTGQAPWIIDGNGLKQSDGVNKSIMLTADGVKCVTTAGNALPYGESGGTPAVPGTAEVTFTAAAVGETEISQNGITYKFIVTDNNGHTHNYVYDASGAKTATTHTLTCECGETKTANHTWDADASCTHAPVCTVCSYVGTTVDHDMVAATCNAVAHCANCDTQNGTEFDASNHAGPINDVGGDDLNTPAKVCQACGVTTVASQPKTPDGAVEIEVEKTKTEAAPEKTSNTNPGTATSGNVTTPDGNTVIATWDATFTENGGGSNPQPGEPSAWDDDADYKIGDRVVYEGKIYECISDHHSNAWWYPSASPSLWKLIGDANASASLMAVPADPMATTWTINVSFTGVNVGRGLLTLGDVKYVVTVTEPEVTCDHNWSNWTDAGNGKHTRTCSVCNETETADHTYGAWTAAADGHSKTCTVCSNVVTEAHNFVGANCQDNGICSACNAVGAKAPNTHKETETVGYKAPTETEEGYTGDVVCKYCKALVEEGTTIPVYIPGIDRNIDIEVKFEGTKSDVQYTDVRTDVTPKPADQTNVEVKEGDTVIATYSVKSVATEHAAVTTYQAVKSSFTEQSYYLGNGTTYIKLNADNSLSPVTAAEATLWDITAVTGGYTIKAKDSDIYLGYVKNARQSTPRAGAEASDVWEYSESAGFFFDASNQNETIKCSLNTNNTDVRTTYTADVTSNIDFPYQSHVDPAYTTFITTVTFTGITPGETYVNVNNTRYHVTVKDINLVADKLTVHYFITNRKVIDDIEGSGDVTKVLAKTDELIATETGASLSDLFPNTGHGQTSGDEYADKVLRWKGVKLDADNHQLDNQDAKNSADKSMDGIDWNYIRYFNDRWAVSFDGITWKQVNEGDMMVVYYLQETAVTKEITTYVRDWGPSPADYKSHGDDFCVLDFAVRYEDGKRIPAFDGTVEAEPGHKWPSASRTMEFHCHNWAAGGKVDDPNPFSPEGEILYGRRVDTIWGVDSPGYEVYMVTVTPRADTVPDGGYFAAGTSKNPKQYTYTGTEKIAWLLTPETAAGYDFQWDPHYYYTDEDGNTVYNTGLTTEGKAWLDFVVIPNHEALLVTYYLRAKVIDGDNVLTVNFHDATASLEGGSIVTDSNGNVTNLLVDDNGVPVSSSEFYQYFINTATLTHPDGSNVVIDGEIQHQVFPGVAPNGTQNGIYTGTVNVTEGNNTNPYHQIFGATVTNSVGTTQTVNAILSQIPTVPGKYRTGRYDMVKFVLSEDKKTLDIYYVSDTSPENHYMVLDFGVPTKFSAEIVGKAGDKDMSNMTVKNLTQINSYLDGGRYGSLTMTYEMVESKVTPMVNYTPKGFMNGAEHVWTFKVDVDFNDGTGSDTFLHDLYIIPATTVYYEDNIMFAEAGSPAGWALLSNGNYNRQQGVLVRDPDAKNYGYDDANNNILNETQGSVLLATELGTSMTFSFQGTGAELYARCTRNSSVATILLYNEAGKLLRVMVVDTKMKVEGDIQNSTDTTEFNYLAEMADTFGTPIATIDGLPYGTYTMKIVNGSAKDARNGLYIDGIRITNPMDKTEVINTYKNGQNTYPITCDTLYAENGEKDPTFIEVRDALVGSINVPANFNKDTSEYYGALYGQLINQLGEDGPVAVMIRGTNTSVYADGDAWIDCLNNGPKNEVYMKPGDKLEIAVSSGFNFQLGVKMLNDHKAGDYYTSGQITVNTAKEQAITSTTDMYYKLNPVNGKITVENTGNCVLSVTRLKAIPTTATPGQSVLRPMTEDEFVKAMHGYVAPAVTFSDVPANAWYADAVNFVAQQGFMTGKAAAAFAPKATLTRAEMVTVLYRMAGAPEVNSVARFSDVKLGAWYSEAVAWAVANDITNGVSADKFNPNGTVTRQQMVVFMARYAAMNGADVTVGAELNGFADAASISGWAVDAFRWAYANGIVKGDGTKLDPKANTTRAQFAQVIYNYYK